MISTFTAFIDGILWSEAEKSPPFFVSDKDVSRTLE